MKKQHGVTLIEVLVTIVIMAFGLLGVAQMQTVSLKTNFEASQRTIATYLVNNIISRIRSLPSSKISKLGKYEEDFASISSAPACTQQKPCSIDEKIKSDLWEWKLLVEDKDKNGELLNNGLVNARGCINISNNQVRVTISWDGIGKSKASSITSCGSAENNRKRRSIDVYTLI